MSIATGVSPAEYLATTYRPDREFLEGELLERHVGEWDHSRLQTLLSRYLSVREKEWGVLVAVEQRVQVKENWFRIPDVLILMGQPPTEGIVTRPPFLCVEILSSTDRMAEMQERIQDYLSFGVNYVWVIDPYSRRAFVYTDEAMREVKDGVLYTKDPEIRVRFLELE